MMIASFICIIENMHTKNHMPLLFPIVSHMPLLFPTDSLQVPDEFERVLVGIQSYISIRSHFDDIAFSVFETDEGNSPNKKVLLIS